MKRICVYLGIFILFSSPVLAQVIFFIPGVIIGSAVIPEHGFLPGKKFQYYPSIGKYDLNGRKFRVEIYDVRQEKKLTKVDCSDIVFTGTSEFADPDCIYKVGKYIDTLFRQAGASIDSAANDTIQVKFEGIDARLIGFGSIRAHGLCQIKVKYKGVEKTYCIDITDADKHSPVSKNAFVTRKTATRIIASASIREVVELFMVDMVSDK